MGGEYMEHERACMIQPKSGIYNYLETMLMFLIRS